MNYAIIMIILFMIILMLLFVAKKLRKLQENHIKEAVIIELNKVNENKFNEVNAYLYLKEFESYLDNEDLNSLKIYMMDNSQTKVLNIIDKKTNCIKTVKPISINGDILIKKDEVGWLLNKHRLFTFGSKTMIVNGEKYSKLSLNKELFDAVVQTIVMLTGAETMLLILSLAN